MRPEAFAQQLDRGQLRREGGAELVRDIAEHAVACAARRFQIGLVAQDLHLDTLHRGRREHDRRAGLAVAQAQHLAGAALRGIARSDDRAVPLAGALAVGQWLGAQHIAAEAADDLRRRQAQQLGDLGIGVADAPIGIDRIDALD